MAPSPSTHRPLLALALLVVVGGLLWWILRSSDEPETAGAPVERAPESHEPPPKLTGAPGATAPTAPAPGPGPAPSREPTWRLTYDVLDADGTPRHHNRGAIFDRNHEELAVATIPHNGPATEGNVEVAGGAYLVVWAHHRVPWVSAWLEPPASGERHLVVRLEHGLEVAGVVYAHDGVTVIPSAQVQLWRHPEEGGFWPPIQSRTGLVDREGRFLIGGLPPGAVKLRAKAYDRNLGVPVGLEAEAGDTDLRIHLGPVGSIAFLLVDESTGLALQTKRWSMHGSDGGAERLWMWGSNIAKGEATEPKPTNFSTAVPGRTYRFRAEAQGYEPSEPQVVTIPAEGGRRTLRFDLRPDPESVAHLTIRVGTDDPKPPVWVCLTHYVTPLSRNMNTRKLVDGYLALELPPGPIHLSVGGGWKPVPEKRDTFWIPVDVTLDLLPGEDREVDVWLRQGGWVVLTGNPDPRPGKVTFRQGEDEVTRHAGFGMLDKETGYSLAVLPPGTWTLEYVDRKRGCRATAEVKAGQVTRLTPEMLEAFTVEEAQDD